MRERRFDPLRITEPPIINPLGAANIVCLGWLNHACHQFFNFGLSLIGQLKPVRAKEFNPVVMMRVVACRNHNAHFGAHGCR